MNGNNILFSYKNNILEEETIFFLLKKKDQILDTIFSNLKYVSSRD